MSVTKQKITPFLWFDKQAEEAANFYVAVFKNSRVVSVTRYSEEGYDVHGQPPGTAMNVTFELEGQTFTALNAGPSFKFNEAVSFVVNCDSQEEVDHYWDKLSEGGDPSAQACGWLKDQYGLSWQVVPKVLPELLENSDTAKSGRVMSAIMNMKKLEIEALERA